MSSLPLNKVNTSDPDTDLESSIGSLNDSNSVEYTPCVRYGWKTANGFQQQYKLTPLGDEPPKEAQFVSPVVYFVSEAQEERLSEGTPPKTIQKECEKDGKAFYNVVAESDALDPNKSDTKSGETVASWLREFAEDYVRADNYQIFYSGNRSLHLHTDMWTKFGELGELKKLAESFIKETDGDLDTSIYSSMPQFRMVGTKHDKTNLYKVPIQEDFSQTNLIRQSQSEGNYSTSNDLPTYYVAGIGDIGSLPTEIGNHLLSPLIKESADIEKYPGKPFSPYAVTGGGDYSVTILNPIGGLIEEQGNQYVRAYIYTAIGGSGYLRHSSYSKVLLSGHDVAKWNYDQSDTVVMIGGRSRNSKIMQISPDETVLLDSEMYENGKEGALSLLKQWGYDTGKRGYHHTNYSSPQEQTKAVWIKQQIDSGERDPTYEDMVRVSCRLLRIRGWQAAWDWIERTFGEDFKPEKTYKRLKVIVETYEDYNHVQVPPQPDSSTEVSQI